MSLEKKLKEKHTKWLDLNAKIRKGWVSRVPSHFPQPMLHKIVLRYLTLFLLFVWFVLKGEAKLLSIILMNGVCMPSFIGTKQKKKKNSEMLYFYPTQKNHRLSNIFLRLFFFYLFILLIFKFFTISATLFSNSACCLYSRQRHPEG